MTIGDNFTLSINLSDEKEQQRIFDTLADGGKVDYPLHDTFWGARFGMVTDRYSIHWQLNCEKKPA